MTEPCTFYQQQTAIFQIEQKKNKRLLYLYSLFRLAAFLVFVISPFLFYARDKWLAVLLPLAGLSLFLFFVNRFQKIQRYQNFLKNLLKINSNEIEATQHRFNLFDGGKEFTDPDHFYTYDLDVFGNGSLFQFINRTTTPAGKRALASMLKEPLLDCGAIRKRQGLVAELASNVEWRQRYAATGMQELESDDESLFIQLSGVGPIPLKSEKLVAWLIPLLVAFSLSSIVAWAATGISVLFQISLILQMLFWGWQYRAIKASSLRFGKQAGVLAKYAALLKMVETFSWQSEEAVSRISELQANGKPSEEIRQLEKMVSAFDNRNNFLLGILLNLMFCWDVWFSLRFLRWQRRNTTNFSKWLGTLAFFDAVNSLSNFRFNHVNFAFPNPVPGEFIVEAKDMGHPLIDPRKRIDNEVLMQGHPHIVIVTGANMSGKSTFLRTIGVNMMLAMCGAPVCAQSMKFSPVMLFSNMRTTDSLFDDESYFFAELKRLRYILDELERGTKLFIILDEILKGTNSVDKLHGSQQLIKRLINFDAQVVIATHDLKLTEMEAEFPGIVRNQCFEIEITNDEMVFDYKLRNGATHVMNATFLMKKMGIIG